MRSIWLGARVGTAVSLNANLTAFINFSSSLFQTGNEPVAEMPVREAGDFLNLSFRVVSNTLGLATTYTVRKSGVDTGITVSVAAGATGLFKETSTSETFAATDEICCKVVTGASGAAIQTALMKIEFEPTDTSKTVVLATSIGATVNFSANSTTRFTLPFGLIGDGATESQQNWRTYIPLTAADLYANIITNTRITTSTVVSRKNSANGGQAISVGAGVTGILEDTSGSDTLISGDDYCHGVTTLTGGGTIGIFHITSSLTSTEGKFPLCAGANAGATIGVNTTTYNPLAGRLEFSSTQLRSQFDPEQTFYAQFLSTNVTANTITTTPVTATIMDGGAAGVGEISIPVGGTGQLVDSSGIDEITGATDLVNYRVQTPNTSGSITFRYLSVIMSNSNPAAVATPLRMMMGVGQ